jgi:1,4-alpha-glucan branching enzyme
VTDRDFELVVAGRHSDPHRVLGLHDGVVRAYRPDAAKMRLIAGSGEPVEMKMIHPAGLFEGRLDSEGTEGADDSVMYELEAVYARGGEETAHRFCDPYRSWPTLGDMDLHLFGEGRHHRLWEVLGSHFRSHEGRPGVAFAVWAPNARAVRVVGDWNFWDGRLHQMRSLGSSGVWELFIPGVEPGARYKYELVAADDRLILKTDPMAFRMEQPPATASVVVAQDGYEWADGSWLERRASGDLLHQPMSIYELHLGSWRYTDSGMGDGGMGDGATADGGEGDGAGGRRPMTYRELADELPRYLSDLGFTHVEFMPVAEHPFSGSWGYQVSGYYAPTARFGSPDDFRALVDALHQAGLGVIVDWVPAHFPKDEFALARFDGTALYEHSDPRQGEHQDWGTLIFNFGRNEVRNFLLANALYWIEQFHIDGLRVDAVASMLYLDYSREPGHWVPNKFGGRENLDAVTFLKQVNETVFGLYPGATMLAEESTAWPGVSRPTYLGGLGFGFKWNMGWMHDTLDYFSHDPVHRRYHHSELTFGLIYAWSENFVLPLSHDEVVHGKGSLLNKMPGDRWQQLANLRALYAWMWAHPGKQLLFMGAELAPEREWNYEQELDWWILEHWEGHRGVRDLLRSLNLMYREHPALWERDDTAEGFEWVDADDSDQSVISFIRLRPDRGYEGAVLCVANLTPVPRYGYRIGLPSGGRWRELLNTDAAEWGGSGVGNMGGVDAVEQRWHGRPFSAELTLPPLGALWLTAG